mgnify:CR=1 FL=1
MSFCPKCGAQLAEGTAFCPKCGYKVSENPTVSSEPAAPAPAQAPASAPAARQDKPCPENYLLYSILVTLFCCLPFGIVGIIKSAQVSSKYQAGDYDGALQSSKDAKKWSLIALLCGLAWIILYVIFFVILGVASAF